MSNFSVWQETERNNRTMIIVRISSGAKIEWEDNLPIPMGWKKECPTPRTESRNWRHTDQEVHIMDVCHELDGQHFTTGTHKLIFNAQNAAVALVEIEFAMRKGRLCLIGRKRTEIRNIQV